MKIKSFAAAAAVGAAINVTDRTVRYYRSAGCSGHVGALAPNMSGTVTRYVMFD